MSECLLGSFFAPVNQFQRPQKVAVKSPRVNDFAVALMKVFKTGLESSANDLLGDIEPPWTTRSASREMAYFRWTATKTTA